MQDRFVVTPEFHATNAHVPGPARPASAPATKPKATKPFKAAVMLLLRGGMDSWTVLTPLADCASTNNRTLLEQYVRRVDMSLMNRGDAAAATWIFRGDEMTRAPRGRFSDESRRRRGRDADIPRRRDARASGTTSIEA